MPLPRVLMLVGLLLLPAGLFYSMANHGSPEAKQSSVIEHLCLGVGAGLFLIGRVMEKRRTS